MAVDPVEYAWSSCRERLGLFASKILDPDPCYLALGESEVDRRECYRAYLDAGVAPA